MDEYVETDGAKKEKRHVDNSLSPNANISLPRNPHRSQIKYIYQGLWPTAPTTYIHQNPHHKVNKEDMYKSLQKTAQAEDTWRRLHLTLPVDDTSAEEPVQLPCQWYTQRPHTRRDLESARCPVFVRSQDRRTKRVRQDLVVDRGCQ